jgi:tripartite ATP-independent transporter DctM subunit
VDLEGTKALGLIEKFAATIAVVALCFMLLIPAIELTARPFLGGFISNAALLTQHLGLVLSLMGAIAAFPAGHLSTLTGSRSMFDGTVAPKLAAGHHVLALLFAGFCALLLCTASFDLVMSEREASQALAYGIDVWMVQVVMPLGYALIALALVKAAIYKVRGAALRFGFLVWVGFIVFAAASGLFGSIQSIDLSVFLVAAIFIATGGAPIFAVIGMITIGLFISVSQPLASIPLSQYAMTVNPSLPALPLYTLAGLLFAKSTAARRLSELISFIFGGGWRASVAASAVLCSAFTALTGGSGVTLLALGGILLPMLRSRGYPEQRGIGLITSASALGVLLAPSVPLIMYAILARVPIQTMLLAGLLPALLMVLCLLWIGGFMRHSVVEVARAELLWENADTSPPQITRARADDSTAASVPVARAASRWRQALWELMAAPVALVPLISGWATPTESAALTAFYALIVVSVIRRELSWTALWSCFLLTAQLIGGVMLILGMALGLTNFLVDAGIPDQAIDWVQSYIQSPQAFLLAAVCFIALAGALMEIYAALVVLVPLMLPLAMSYGIHPVHFGIVFLATLEMGFLCPPAGMNLYFASAVFRKPLRIVMTSILPALLAIFVGSALIALMPEIALTLPKAFNQL